MKKKILLIILSILVIITLVISIRWYYKKKNDPYATFILPRLEISYFEIQSISREQTNLDMIFKINNPSPIGLQIDSLKYHFYIAGVEVMESTYPKMVKLESNDSGVITMPVTIRNGTLVDILESLENKGIDSVNYEMRSEFYIHLPFLKNKPQEVTVSRYLPLFLFPEITLMDIDVEKWGFKNTVAEVQVKFYNRNNLTFSLKEIMYKVNINGEEVSRGSIDTAIIISARDSVLLNIPVSVKVKEIASSLPDLIFNKDDTKYSFYAELKLVSEYNAIKDSKVIITSEGMVKELTDMRKK